MEGADERGVSRRRLLPAALACAALLIGVDAVAAAPGTATFTSSAEGWTATGTPTWSVVSGAMQAVFAPIGFPSPGENGALVATNTASGGNFVGDYGVAGIGRAGFDFLAFSTNPSSLTIEWTDGTNTYYRDFTSQLPSPGTWSRLEIDFTSRAGGGWSGGPADEASFLAARAAISRFTTRVARRGTSGQSFQLDNVFIDRLPAPAAMALEGVDLRVAWTNLRTAAESRAPTLPWNVETTTDLRTNWTAAATLAPTGRVADLLLPGIGSVLQIRLAR